MKNTGAELNRSTMIIHAEPLYGTVAMEMIDLLQHMATQRIDSQSRQPLFPSDISGVIGERSNWGPE